ncbi:ABC transporter A, ABCA [Parasponia andersonii]|uniref:ABC transporter A, ABCA n=1 Tax=Parasponia andersonii TaxID=3476 RepID=A0A2P5ADV6_PARAD|nr:ABC transporter A, ABCA [Parasponia andersonii]
MEVAAFTALWPHNPVRPIPHSEVIRTSGEVDEWHYSNPMHCPGALHFMERNSSVISYGIQTNSTSVTMRGKFEDPTFKFQIPLQISAEREIARSLIGVQNFSWVFGFKEFAHPPQKSFSAIASVGSPFFLATAINPMHCPGALHFMERNSSVISYGIQTNSTSVTMRGKFEDPTFKFQIPLQISAEREIARSLIGVQNFSWVFGFKEFAHPPQKSFSAIASVGSPFFLATAMFGFVFQMSSLVAEKELKLRQAMTLMGLYDSAYWFSWLAWEGILTFLSSLSIVLFGLFFQFDFFLHNSSAVVFLLFFLFQLNMLGFAFMLSAFVSKSSSPTAIGFFIFLIGSTIQLSGALKFPYSRKFSQQYRIIWSIFPPNLLTKAVWLLSDATSTPQDVGISWSKRAMCAPNDDDCVITINDIYKWLVATFIIWLVLAIYFDNIMENEFGMRKPMFYILKPGYWTGRSGHKMEESSICRCLGSLSQENHIPADDEDVLEEENIIKQQMTNGIDNDQNIAVQIRGLVKTYPESTKIGCFKCKKTLPYHALQGLWLNFAKDQLFCLLGTNRAGKTTTINCLTGITTSDKWRGMLKVRLTLLCIYIYSKFDVLWEALSGQEHLHLFASIKGLPQASIDSVIDESLAEVRLSEAANVRAGNYSGGMKRRLSVAIALIGDPKLVILDEPTTGMDPVTRRHIWDILTNKKKGRSIILATHSMEEAEVLSDRIGIMANGRLRCIGTSVRLKSRFGAGFIANVNFNGQTSPNRDVVHTTHHEVVKQLFKHHLGVVSEKESESFLTFSIPRDKEVLMPKLLAELQDRENEFGITDIQVGMTTLEEVFLSIARQAELEIATTEGNSDRYQLELGLLGFQEPNPKRIQEGLWLKFSETKMILVHYAYLATLMKLQYLLTFNQYQL